MSSDEAYVNALRADKGETLAYHTKSVVKTEQQLALERLLRARGTEPTQVADLACGGGTLSHHLKALYPAAQFTLCDLDDDALALARQLNGDKDFTYRKEDLNLLSGLADNSFDLVCCWQTLSWINDPKAAVLQAIRIARPGARIFCSALFNLAHDVDIRAQMRDHTRPSGARGYWAPYNTFSKRTVEQWLGESASFHELHPFVPGIDLTHTGKGVGTFTVNSDRGRLQISGGLLMNWAILEIVK